MIVINEGGFIELATWVLGEAYFAEPGDTGNTTGWGMNSNWRNIVTAIESLYAAYTLAAVSHSHSNLFELEKIIDGDLTRFIPNSVIGENGGVCPLNVSGVIDTGYLPSYVDDVLEYANLAAFPSPGVSGKIYIDLDTGKTYRWNTIYYEISKSEVSSVNGVLPSIGNVILNFLYISVPKPAEINLTALGSIENGMLEISNHNRITAFAEAEYK